VNFRVRPVNRLRGRIAVPGDKSISHRAALFGALAEGITEVRGFLESEDCLRTITAIEALGADVTRKGAGEYRIVGGHREMLEPDDVIDCGNSGTTARLLMGVLAGQPCAATLTGDASLRRRPMGRVAEPLRLMGATIVGRAEGSRLPLLVRGARPLHAIAYDTPVASAQVKSAVLLAGLFADGPVTVTEPAASRDHTERMLRQFGARLEIRGRSITVAPGDLHGVSVDVPGDVSSAAFMLVAGAIVRDARITVLGAGVNPTRTGVIDALEAMGANVVQGDVTQEGEPSASLTIAGGPLTGITIAGELIPRLIDEVPVLAVAAAMARGTTHIRDARELRVKESDRIAAIARELGRLGAVVTEQPDGLVIEGGQPLVGARVSSGGDHRLAMALTVAGLVAEGETVVEDTACIATSFPGFAEAINALAGGAAVTVEP
jgi:3-phosphoshikimate 1-carboxyvinyltransferase